MALLVYTRAEKCILTPSIALSETDEWARAVAKAVSLGATSSGGALHNLRILQVKVMERLQKQVRAGDISDFNYSGLTSFALPAIMPKEVCQEAAHFICCCHS